MRQSIEHRRFRRSLSRGAHGLDVARSVCHREPAARQVQFLSGKSTRAQFLGDRCRVEHSPSVLKTRSFDRFLGSLGSTAAKCTGGQEREPPIHICRRRLFAQRASSGLTNEGRVRSHAWLPPFSNGVGSPFSPCFQWRANCMRAESPAGRPGMFRVNPTLEPGQGGGG
jgi:hypothetical protein